jgi:hypothetical protein
MLVLSLVCAERCPALDSCWLLASVLSRELEREWVGCRAGGTKPTGGDLLYKDYLVVPREYPVAIYLVSSCL